MSTPAVGSIATVQPASRMPPKGWSTVTPSRISVRTGTKEFPPFRLDIANECLWRSHQAGEDERILLTPKAFAVLRYLVEHAGRLVTQDELLEAVWPDAFVQPEVLKFQIAHIRAVLGDRPRNPLFIETLPRRGYRFIASTKETESAQPAMPARAVEPSPAGKNGELVALRDSLQETLCGERQLVFVTGEPIGKTALLGALSDRVFREIRDAVDTLPLTAAILLVLRVG